MKPTTRLICLILALATLVLYLPVRQHDFVLYDDPEYVSENWRVQSGLTWPNIQWAFTTFHFSNWHPLTWLSHMLDCELFGLNAGAHHVVNVIFHVANTLLLFLFLLRSTRSVWPSALVAALFAWHPFHVEPVAWISSRKDVLSTLFGFACLLSYERFVARNDRRYFWLSAGCLALGLMAKPMLVTLPFVLVLLDYWPFKRLTGSPKGAPPNGGRRPLTGFLLEKWPFFLLAAGSSVVTYLAQRGEAVVTLERFPLPLRVGNAIVSYLRYAAKTIWPTDLAVIYPLPAHLPLGLVAGALLVLAAITWVLWRARFIRPYCLMGWLWFLGALVPVIGLVQVGGQAMADRYTYIPLIGLFIAFAWAIEELRPRWRWWPAIPIVVAAGCVAATVNQLRYWQDSRTLFSRAVAVTRDNAIAHINLGLALEKAGRPDLALEHAREALRIDPNRPQAHNNLGNLLSAMGKSEEALDSYRAALNLQPDAPLPHMNLGAELVKLNRIEEGLRHYALAAQHAPENPLPHYLTARALQQRGQNGVAIPHFRRALELDPNNPKALTHLARVLAADPDPNLRNGAEAVRFAERAHRLTGEREPFVLDTLGMAYAEIGAFAEAASLAKAAAELAASAGDTNTAALFSGRAELYRARRPYRETGQRLDAP